MYPNGPYEIKYRDIPPNDAFNEAACIEFIGINTANNYNSLIDIATSELRQYEIKQLLYYDDVIANNS